MNNEEGTHKMTTIEELTRLAAWVRKGDGYDRDEIARAIENRARQLEKEKPLVALTPGGMKEFDPASERRFPVLVATIVNPGCTLELQIDNAVTGQVTRLTSTEDVVADLTEFKRAIAWELEQAWTLWRHPDNANAS